MRRQIGLTPFGSLEEEEEDNLGPAAEILQQMCVQITEIHSLTSTADDEPNVQWGINVAL